ncbi:hypothetical protein [Adhaeribacter pallidiroseus]|uniref:Uncharacterized protein n=1 Tax=Adhaeribacter pallidiroseus TaxID=2072847 RepID=A0A369QK54_9BACT|nr:hypothetical protein [Adhaeribacter pallidiroseus]RDC65114.1 hypothetical protein AHMF7616_03738 [Adhaeribacter pallidiroseus]
MFLEQKRVLNVLFLNVMYYIKSQVEPAFYNKVGKFFTGKIYYYICTLFSDLSRAKKATWNTDVIICQPDTDLKKVHTFIKKRNAQKGDNQIKWLGLEE